jgi:hypothetical protein
VTPYPSKLGDRLVPSTEWTRYTPVNGQTVEQTGGVYISPNVDTTCFTIRQVNPNDEDDDLIHICDWAELRAVIDQFMADRAAEAAGAGE